MAGNLPDQSLFSTSVYYTSPRARLSAERLRRSLGDTNASVRLPAELSDFGLGADVVVAIGKAFSGVTPPPEQAAEQAAPPPSRPLVQAAAADGSGDFFLLQKRTRYQLLYPTRVPLGSTYGEAIETGENPYRVYKLGKHGKALSVDAHTAHDSSHAWGLRYTTGPTHRSSTSRPAGLLGRTPGAPVHERPGDPPHRGVLRRRAVQGIRRRRRLDQQLAR